jgi:hypothetical protein
MGYCRPVFKPTATDSYRKDVTLVFTMVDDKVVNRIIMAKGFPPFGSEYLKMVKREIKALFESEDLYRQFSDDYFFETVLMVSRYIIAWGFLKYFKLEPSELEIIRKFIEIVSRYHIQKSIKPPTELKRSCSKMIFLLLSASVKP